MAADLRNRKPCRTAEIARASSYLACVFLLLASRPADAFLARPAVFAALGSVTKAPSGWQQFCAENPDDCRPDSAPPGNMTLTPELLQQLYSVNGFVNSRVKWTSDDELYGKLERWTFPLDRGDCEDIVLLKRRMLSKAGWPLSTLLITSVEEKTVTKGRHAVLTVLTDRGEFILDNQTPEILFANETNYRYLTRQTTTNPNVWVAFSPERPVVAR